MITISYQLGNRPSRSSNNDITSLDTVGYAVPRDQGFNSFLTVLRTC
jgi:hypothetical protein